ncbi:MAG: TIGR04168 family protein [Chroococcales cyanobacterium]
MLGDHSITIAVVGDVHHQWEAEDAIALHHLNVDLVLFVGDFGNEAVEVVRQIAAVDIPKAAIMGNHDAWYTASHWGRKKSPYDHDVEDWVQTQLELLGEAHVGFGKLDLPQLELSVVGSRPFSWGGQEWKNEAFYRDRYGIHNFAESTQAIVQAAKKTTYDTVIFLGHNGPFGLGDQAEDSCGRDWNPLGGDFGDPDFADAIAKVRMSGKRIPLVTFGHMHHRLRHRKDVLRTRVSETEDGTIYLNAASVPRIMDVDGDRWRNFSLVSLVAGEITNICLVWVGGDFTVKSQEILYSSPLTEESLSQELP